MASTKADALTGKALLQKVKDLSHLTKREKARECGYYTTPKDGQIRVDVTGFYDALLEARGIQLDPDKGKMVVAVNPPTGLACIRMVRL